MRVVFGTTLVYNAVVALARTHGLVGDLAHSLPGILGLLLLVGLWTPLAGALVAIHALWQACSEPSQVWQSLWLGAAGAALALLGPGTWSVDARLFGWTEIKIPEEKSTDTPQAPSD